MKKIVYLLLSIAISVLIVSIFVKPIIIFLFERQLKKAIPGSSVSIEECDFKPLNLLAFSDIKIKKKGTYDFRAKRIGIQYNLLPIFKGNIFAPSLKDALVAIDLKIDHLDSQGLSLKEVAFNVSKMNDKGYLHIKRISYNKANIEEINSKARLSNNTLFLDSLSAKVLDGEIQGDTTIKISEKLEYFINLNFINLDLEAFVEDFKLNKKFQITGRLGGIVSLQGEGLNLTSLAGDLSTAEGGGVLNIKDQAFLENLARYSKQTLDIVVESFKDYHYNTGLMNMSLDKDNIIVDISLDGKAGKRNLTITLHDFGFRKEEL